MNEDKGEELDDGKYFKTKAHLFEAFIQQSGFLLLYTTGHPVARRCVCWGPDGSGKLLLIKEELSGRQVQVNSSAQL
ncbi:unnamed protein product [Boreogadus saida]